MINNTSIKEGNVVMRKTAFQVAPLFQRSLWLRILRDMNNTAYYVLGNIRHHLDVLLVFFSKSKPMWEKVMWHRHYRLFNNTVTEELLMTHPLLLLTSKQADVCSQDAWLAGFECVKRSGLQDFIHIISGSDLFFSGSLLFCCSGWILEACSQLI